MAINRILNAIWAEVSARGSLIKTATTKYVPSPGTLTVNSAPNGANNQAVYAVTSGSPFTPVDANGLAVVPDGQTQSALPVTAGLGDGLTANMPPLDENSGQYQVLRQYGDIYMYNDGNVIMWGGNGKNFNFGNSYEEAHAWAGQSCVYNNEQFTIPQGAMSLFLAGVVPQPANYNGPASVDAYEWLGGTVSKSWGNEYTFSYGRSYEWSGGPNNYVDAYGNSGANLTDVMQGKHCTFSYGNGYEESLVEWTSSSTWFHADDPGSPYLARIGDKWQSSNLGSGWQSGNLLVSKAFGPTYDYHYGSTLSIQEGPSEDRSYGSSWSTVVGDSTENVTGNSTSTVNGNSDDTVTGNSTSKTVGNSTETYWGESDAYFMGGKNEMMLAGCDSINLSAQLEIVAGIATSIFLGAKMELVLGARMEMKVGPAVEINSEPTVKMSPAEFKAAAGAKIEALGTAIQLAALNLLL